MDSNITFVDVNGCTTNVDADPEIFERNEVPMTVKTDPLAIPNPKVEIKNEPYSLVNLVLPQPKSDPYVNKGELICASNSVAKDELKSKKKLKGISNDSLYQVLIEKKESIGIKDDDILKKIEVSEPNSVFTSEAVEEEINPVDINSG